MTPTPPTSPDLWTAETLPKNVRVGPGSVITGTTAFRRFRSRSADALVIGQNCTVDGTQFAVGEAGRVIIGDNCYFTNAVLMCELELRIGNYVVIGWNTSIADSDFHPLDPALRIADAIACSPLGQGKPRPPVECRAVVIEDNVYIGPAATILKGVRIGAGAFIEPGAVVTRDVKPGQRVSGNPALPV